MVLFLCVCVCVCVQMYDLLRQWKLLDPEAALELLDYKFQDPVVRTFAIRCLKKMT